MKKKRKGGQRIPVIFRMFNEPGAYPERDCIALFPTICDDYTGITCTSYIHIGQHSSADPDGLIRGTNPRTRPATKAEYKELALELQSRGYRYKIYKRLQRKWYSMRVEQASQHRANAQANPDGLPWTPEAREEAMRPV
jgi:hypothetical protein